MNRTRPSGVAAEPTPDSPEQSPPTAETSRPPPRSSMVVPARRKVLIVDPDPHARLALARDLAASYEVLEAGDGLEALEILGRTRPAAVFTEIDMPRVNGLMLARHVRMHPELARVPVFFVTVRSAVRDVIQTMQVGAKKFWTKPVPTRELVATVHKIVG